MSENTIYILLSISIHTIIILARIDHVFDKLKNPDDHGN